MTARISPTCNHRFTAHLTSLAALIAGALGCNAFGGSYTFTLIADSAGILDKFYKTGWSVDTGIPSINNEGMVAFWATLDAGGEGIYKGNGGAPLAAATTTSGIFSTFQRGHPVINDDGIMAFWAARTPASGGGHGIFNAFGGGTVCTTSTYVGVNETASIAPTGPILVGFRADPAGGGAGIYRTTVAVGGATSTIATGPSGLSSEGPAINAAGSAAFVGTLAGVSGVHVGAGALVTTTIADTAGIFSGFGSICSINAAGKVAFRAELDAGGSGIYVAGVGIAPTAAITSPFGLQFGTPAINSAGHVIVRKGAAAADAIYKGNAASDRIIGAGDVLGGKTIHWVKIGRQALNDRDNFAFQVMFNDSPAWSTAIYRANFCAADTNGDHWINVTDLLAVINAWGVVSPGHSADINGDSVVGIDDLLAVINGWGVCP